MSELFLRIVNMSISASWLVLAVLGLRLVWKKGPKWVHVLLWGIVEVRLLFPFFIESALSLIPSAETIPADIGINPTPAINSGIEVINDLVNPVISHSNTPANGTSVNPLQITVYLEAEDFAVPHNMAVPAQLTGYEYQVRACMKALEEGAIECPEMPHSESLRVMEICDHLRMQWGVKYPFEK